MHLYILAFATYAFVHKGDCNWLVLQDNQTLMSMLPLPLCRFRRVHVAEIPQRGIRHLSKHRSMRLRVVPSCTLSDGDFQWTIQEQECLHPCAAWKLACTHPRNGEYTLPQTSVLRRVQVRSYLLYWEARFVRSHGGYLPAQSRENKPSANYQIEEILNVQAATHGSLDLS